MCGIAAVVWRDPSVPPPEVVGRIAARMEQRGPDASGDWHASGISLAHRRLAVIDLDARANQPMTSGAGDHVLVFNGEIYNYEELRARLVAQGVQFSTHSDTEVILELFARHGADMLPMLRGMFALAIWDVRRRALFVARDPYGIKPLYVATSAQGVLVASQVKALLASGLVSREPDPVGQASFWLTGSVSEPHTWFRDVCAFPAGSFAWIDDQGVREPVTWLDVASPFSDESSATADLEPTGIHRELAASVAAHLVADVPVGVFASGGIDSAAVAGLAAAATSARITAVTLQFREFDGQSADETADAARIAAHFGLDHHVRLVTRDEFEIDRAAILSDMDQPTVDGVNTWYASKAMRELGLKVVLSGVGGDELFQGYPHTRQLGPLVSAFRGLGHVPGALNLVNRLAGRQARRSGNSRWVEMPERFQSLIGAWTSRRGLFGSDDLPALMGTEFAAAALGAGDPVTWSAEVCGPLPADARTALSVLESKLYLGNQLLRDSDWASMAHSLELRTPLVDSHLLLAVAPHARELRRYPQKQLLATAPPVPLPPEVVARKKTGFAIPVTQWLADGSDASHPTRAWAEVVARECYGS